MHFFLFDHFESIYALVEELVKVYPMVVILLL